MKFKHLLIYSLCVLGLGSCKKDKEPFNEKTINTVYWDITLPASAKNNAVILTGEVGNSNDVDSVNVQVDNLTTGETVKTVTLKKTDLTLTDRKDFPSSTIKWYKINYKPNVSFETDDEISFTLIAYTPFGASQDLRPQITSSIIVE